MNIKKIKENTMKIMLYSFIHYLNDELSKDLNQEELDDLANIVFNGMTNSLYPEDALIWNEEIFKIANHKHDILKDIYNTLGWNK